MPPRRGARGGRRKKLQKSDEVDDNAAVTGEVETQDESKNGDQTVETGLDDVQPEEPNPENQLLPSNKCDEATNEGASANIKPEGDEEMSDGQNESDEDLPFKAKVSHLPANYNVAEFDDYIQVAFNLKVPKIVSPEPNSSWLLLSFATKEEQEKLTKLLHNHVWKKKVLKATALHPSENLKRPLEDEDDYEVNSKKPKLDDPILTLEEEVLSESLPLYNVPYKEQNRLTVQDVELLSSKLHAFMCVRNPDLAGWAEAMCEKNGGYIFKIEPLKASPFLDGYRNKCKFRIGKNEEGVITVGFCLNENENKIIGVQPGDKLIHLPDSMKYTAKKFENYIQSRGKEPYDRKKKSGFWDHITVRIAPEGDLMLVVVMYHNNLSEDQIKEIKEDVKNYFITGEGRDCKLFSLYFQVMVDKPPVLPSSKLELLIGEPYFEEHISGLRFHVGPFSILNVNSPSAENIYNSIIELAEPTSDAVVIDLCSGTGGIAFTISSKCEQVIAIESQEDNVKDALKTKELNDIKNVELIKGKVEEELTKVFERFKGRKIIPIIDPPRQGLVQKAISQLRANESIEKLVYVCSNSKMGIKNFLDLCSSADKKEGTFGNPLTVEFIGLPFVPTRAVPVDVAPYTVNNTVVILFERVDPSTFPPAKKPPPELLKSPQLKRDEKKKNQKKARRGVRGGAKGKKEGETPAAGSGAQIVQPAQKNMRGGKKFRGAPPMGNRFRGPPGRGGRGGPGFNAPRGRFPPPFMRQGNGGPYNLAADYAFKAGLALGLQAVNRGQNPGMGNFGNFNNPNFRNNPPGGNFGGFGGGFNQGEENQLWHRAPNRTYGNPGGFGPNKGKNFNPGRGGSNGNKRGGRGGNNSNKRGGRGGFQNNKGKNLKR